MSIMPTPLKILGRYLCLETRLCPLCPLFPFLKERVLQTENVCVSVCLSNQSESSISAKARRCRFSLKNWVGLGNQASWTRIWAQFCSKPYWSTRNQWKLSFRESGPTYEPFRLSHDRMPEELLNRWRPIALHLTYVVEASLWWITTQTVWKNIVPMQR